MDGMVDAHVHVVAADRGRYPLSPPGVGSRWYEEHPVDAEQFAALSADEGVGRAVLVQAYGAYGTDNRYALDAADAAPDRFSAVVVVASDDPQLEAHLDECGAHPGFRGVRVFAIGDRAPNPLDHPGTRVIFAAARRRGFPLVVATLESGLDAVRRLLNEFPDVPVALDHCGFAPVADVLPLAGHDNLRLKITAHVLHDDPQAVESLTAGFGAGRCAWGSDFPQVDDHTYGALVTLGHRACDGLTATDRELVLGGTAASLWFA